MSLGYRKIKFPKINWNEKEKIIPEMSETIKANLKQHLEDISEGKKINPHTIQQGLRSIGFHKEQPELYKIIEDLCLDYDIKGKELSVDEILEFINEHLGDNETRTGINILHSNMKDKEVNAITPESLSKIIENIGDELSLDDVKYMMQTIAEPSDDINIGSDEFYYIMTKKPADVIKINSVTKKN